MAGVGMGEVVFARRLMAADKAASLPFGSFIAMVHSSKSRSGCRHSNWISKSRLRFVSPQKFSRACQYFILQKLSFLLTCQ